MIDAEDHERELILLVADGDTELDAERIVVDRLIELEVSGFRVRGIKKRGGVRPPN